MTSKTVIILNMDGSRKVDTRESTRFHHHVSRASTAAFLFGREDNTGTTSRTGPDHRSHEILQKVTHIIPKVNMHPALEPLVEGEIPGFKLVYDKGLDIYEIDYDVLPPHEPDDSILQTRVK